ncbi:zinc finger and BTB domain-containing protein 14 isoform X1 [Neodiprion lecontei]|uniref:Zinc finger and BTB domain-containing protein 14 isoform X1 n=1 Tax=Neodiprion lecontei TaxID=441921 RepID=A0A6J0BXB7_NEOLC|nr:zinc finger and BTB domain-containing protein 14 isoform X1 [Neodiprion lecontei]XP_046585687.1 zinc finger and BTB domain-containing protein 14 isoform X1 [Neodiprion lecontei]
MGDKTFNLTWNNHLANLSGLFEGLYRSGSLTDTTLACQGGMLRAHRLVLAACSPYFERVFKEHYGDQPILILKGVAVEEMECLLDFMYRGSIDVAEEHLASLIKTATDLEIRGLSADHKNDGAYQPHTVKASCTTQSKVDRCQIEARVQAIERRKGKGAGASTDGYQQKQKDQDVKLEEIEDDPMVVEAEENFESSMDTSDEQIRRIPPPMYKRETRYKGQKRVPVGRVPRNTDVLDIKIKDCVSLKNSPGEDLFEESMSLPAVKEEPSFGNCPDPTVPTVQLNEEPFEQDQDLDNLGSTSGAASTETTSKSHSSSGKSEVTGKRVSSKEHKAQYKPFSCDLCTLAFTRASHLARHRRVHTGERPFACTLCPRMFARQDKLKQHLDSHLQWPKRRSLGHNLSGHSIGGNEGSCPPTKGRRGRPRKISSEQSAMEEILKFGEFSSLLNKSQNSESNADGEGGLTCVKDEASLYKDVDCSYGCQVENGHDVQ